MLKKELNEGFKDVDLPKGIVTGYFAAFGMKDSDGDIIESGAFAKTIKENGPDSKQPRIKHLLDHNRNHVVGKLLALKEDAHGLYYESKAGSHANGQDFLKMVQDELITEHSIGFSTIREQKKSDGNHMLELHLREGSSLQCWGANQFTPITGLKSAQEVAERIAKFTKALRDGTYTDETFKEIEIELNRLEKQLKSDAGSSTSDSETLYYSYFI